ncbi:MAG: TetR family transcriptional regulator [Bacteroidales bacterium]|jgi:AcrR family transcriptional regulator|nr:TetR family transcriptional regulator [Bacteroidales bacterium]
MAKKSTRDMIIGVAAGLFATRGLRLTTMETIASAAGRGRRTVYMYFRNKAEIYNAVVDTEINSIIRPLREIVSSGGRFEGVLKRYTSERTRLLADILRRNPLLFRDFALEHSRVEKLRERLNREELQILIPCFRNSLKDGNSGASLAPEDYAMIFLNLIKGNDRLLTTDKGFERVEALNLTGTDIFIKGTEPALAVR